jgi:hypothetical protein
MTRWIIPLFAFLLCVTPAFAQSRDDNLVSGSASATTTAATTIIAAPTATRLIYITGVQCGRTDVGTTASSVTFNDDASTVMVLPNSGNGGANNMVFPRPLMVPAATAFKFTSSGSISTVYCNAQGFTGN